MKRSNRVYQTFLVLLSIFLLFAHGEAQTKSKDSVAAGRPVLWEPVNIPAQDLFLGPGGAAMQPDLSKVTFVKEEKGGYSKKYRVKDGSGKTWVAKIGREAQSETVAVRLLSAIGYRTEINYLAPSLTIPGRGTFSNVRLEARPEDVERKGQWKWERNPFEKTPQMNGLILMMAFINNWDLKSSNNTILEKGNEAQYIISDLGVSFGKTGSNSLPLFWWIGRSRNNAKDFARATFIKGVKDNRVKVRFNGKKRGLMKNLTTADARWLADRLTQLSDSQIRDAFRAANYSQGETDLFTGAVRSRIRQLNQAGSNSRLAGKR